MVATGSYTYGGEPAKSFVTFSWCLAEFDRDPHQAPEHHAHDAVALQVHGRRRCRKFPEIPLQPTYAVLDDMERRWREGGHSLHAVYAYRHRVAQHIGDTEAAERYYDQWCTAAARRPVRLRRLRPDVEGVLAGRTAPRRGRDRDGRAGARRPFTCTEQPQSILTALLVPYLRTGRLDEARDAHRRAYRLQRSSLADLESIADAPARSAR